MEAAGTVSLGCPSQGWANICQNCQYKALYKGGLKNLKNYIFNTVYVIFMGGSLFVFEQK